MVTTGPGLVNNGGPVTIAAQAAGYRRVPTGATMNAEKRRGFSLVELTVVVVLGLLVLTAVHTTLTTNLRAYTVVNSKVRSQQTIRGGSQIPVCRAPRAEPAGR